MLEPIKTAVAQLAAIDPAITRALFIVFVLVAVYLFRKAFPRAWEFFARFVKVPDVDASALRVLVSKAWQALPATVIGAATLALSSGGDVALAIKGAVLGALAALAHEVLKAVPWIPYQGQVGKRGLPPVSTGVLLVSFALGSLIGLTSCSPAALPPGCTEEDAGKLATECAALAADCVAKGGSEVACGNICDSRADERAAQCR